MRSLEHIVRFEPGYDCIRFECRYGKPDCRPGSGGSHGRHGVTVRFVSKGDAGAVQFTVYTGWMPQAAPVSEIGTRNVLEWGMGEFHPIPADLGYHSKTPQYEGERPMDRACEWTGGECYYDGSGLNANDGMYALVNGGDDALWTFLDAYYETVFHDAPYPTPQEYARSPRQAVVS